MPILPSDGTEADSWSGDGDVVQGSPLGALLSAGDRCCGRLFPTIASNDNTTFSDSTDTLQDQNVSVPHHDCAGIVIPVQQQASAAQQQAQEEHGNHPNNWRYWPDSKCESDCRDCNGGSLLLRTPRQDGSPGIALDACASTSTPEQTVHRGGAPRMS